MIHDTFSGNPENFVATSAQAEKFRSLCPFTPEDFKAEREEWLRTHVTNDLLRALFTAAGYDPGSPEIEDRITGKNTAMLESGYKLTAKLNVPDRENTDIKLSDKGLIQFGHYPSADGTTMEPIRWRILAAVNGRYSSGRLLLLADKGIDAGAFHDTNEIISWKDSTLREWLNTEFLRYFTNEEQRYMRTVSEAYDRKNFPNRNQELLGNDVFFLLSDEEAMDTAFFKNDGSRDICSARIMEASGLAIKNRAQVSGNTHNSRWWLRSLGYPENCAKYVNYDGKIVDDGTNVTIQNICIRPAFWLDRSALERAWD